MSRPFIDLVAVCDVNTESPGATLARDNGIFVTGDVDELAAMGEDIDIIIEVSGDPTVKPKLKNAFIVSGNRTTIIMHDLVARMMMSIMGDVRLAHRNRSTRTIAASGRLPRRVHASGGPASTR